jgi:ADP-heptose:LPS heptosyltransferase
VNYVKKIEDGVKDKSRVVNLAGKTDMSVLSGVMKEADYMISGDSGNAHLANAHGLKLAVLWGGCGVEHETSPYMRKGLKILKKDLPCAPCWPAENCRFGEPLCLLQLENEQVLTALDESINGEQNHT